MFLKVALILFQLGNSIVKGLGNIGLDVQTFGFYARIILKMSGNDNRRKF